MKSSLPGLNDSQFKARQFALSVIMMLFTFSFTIPSLLACGPYHEWKVIGETTEVQAGDKSLKDCLYPMTAAIADTIPKDRGRLCLIEVLIPAELDKVAKEAGIDRKAIEEFLGDMFTRINSLRHLSITPSNFVLDQLAEKKMDVERLFNPAIMAETARECGIDHFIYATLEDFKVLTRTSVESRKEMDGIKGRFRIESMTLRAKVVNASDGMIEWIDEIRGRHEFSIIFGPKGTREATSEEKIASAMALEAEAAAKSAVNTTTPEATSVSAANSAKPAGSTTEMDAADIARASEQKDLQKLHGLETAHNIEILEYVSTYTNAPGSISIVTHEGQIIPDELIDKAFEFIGSML